MTAHSTAQGDQPHATDSSDSYIHITPAHLQPTSPTTTSTSFEHIPSTVSSPPGRSTSLSGSTASAPASAPVPSGKARLLYCKAHVAIHPTSFKADNIPGYLGIVETAEGEVTQSGAAGGNLLVTWVPDEVLGRMDAEDRAGYKRVEERSGEKGSEREEDGFVFVSLPAPKGEKYAFSIPVTNIYSILVYPPSLSHWYGSATFNLTGGISLPTIYFHDDESPLLASPPASHTTPVPRAQWGFPPFLSLLSERAVLVRSRLLPPKRNMGAELWLVNPNKADREVHEAGVEDDEPETIPTVPRAAATPAGAPAATPGSTPYPPKQTYPNFPVLTNTTPKQTLLTSLSSLTNLSRRKASQILSHPLAQPVVPHLPPAVRSLVNVPGEWERTGRSAPSPGAAPGAGRKGGSDVASEFESARLYLARWARVVAEEGEKARRDEVAAQARLHSSSHSASSPGSGLSPEEDLASSLGVFSLLPKAYAKRPVPNPTRTPQHPITAVDWARLAAQGRDELYVRREIFRRGFSDSSEPGERAARREGWEVLLGVVPWSVGGVGGGEEGLKKREKEREEAREGRRRVYEGLRDKWRAEAGEEKHREAWKEEWHRIDVDCRRTDRNQPIYAVPSEVAKRGNHEKEAGGAGAGAAGSPATPWNWDGKGEEEEGGMAGLNPHIAALRTILMTYHTYSPELGYVQGMSDLLSPIYVVFESNEADSFWGLVGVMKMMESNFLRDQSGMKKQLSTLQQLISVMDPELYAHLERTDSLNLFFVFRWILIAFKREFPFGQVIRLWEVLFTNYYSDHFVLFVALGVLQSHREVIIRYLTEFDEVLKYANDLSGTIDLDTTLAQAEVLFISFRSLVEDLDRENALAQEEQEALEGGGGDGAELRARKGKGKATEVPEEGLEGVEGGVEDEAEKAEKEKEKSRKVVSPEMRELLVGWTPDSA